MPPRKSSKTAHVLNLLTGSKEDSSAEQDTNKKAAEKKNVKKQPSKKQTEQTEAQSADASSDRLLADASAAVTYKDENNFPNTKESEIAALTNEIIPGLSEKEIPISTPAKKMAEEVADILSENSDIDIPEMQTIDPVMEKLRDFNQPSAPVFAESALSDSDQAINTAMKGSPFSYTPMRSEAMPTPISKSAIASMLIAQRKDEEEKDEPEPTVTEITEETPVYENEDMTLVNLTEKAASKRIPEVMKRFNMCTCERCYYDVLALTLNSIPQKTVIIAKDDIERKIKEYELDSTVDLVTAISKSCVHVKISPRH